MNNVRINLVSILAGLAATVLTCGAGFAVK